jgi:AraC-like DNA-binding protein
VQKALPHGSLKQTEYRENLALQYLKDPSVSLSQIARLLGYEEATSFNHAFRRWTGRSPTALLLRPSKSER